MDQFIDLIQLLLSISLIYSIVSFTSAFISAKEIPPNHGMVADAPSVAEPINLPRGTNMMRWIVLTIRRKESPDDTDCPSLIDA
ncbi:hypothetical protein [Paenibacillus sp. OV219]|uniref:hypothetical protein n=1 Tax=Paenibacillus sp. OV219 TaxID=1884377 RepID=UPI0008B1D6B1|nr:hypothetical protein [Paenibacillus sp. OV219]SEO81296.1 hypothetical protein SAMN05518847_11170 [Paenibacillus sp. OV219]